MTSRVHFVTVGGLRGFDGFVEEAAKAAAADLGINPNDIDEKDECPDCRFPHPGSGIKAAIHRLKETGSAAKEVTGWQRDLQFSRRGELDFEPANVKRRRRIKVGQILLDSLAQSGDMEAVAEHLGKLTLQLEKQKAKRFAAVQTAYRVNDSLSETADHNDTQAGDQKRKLDTFLRSAMLSGRANFTLTDIQTAVGKLSKPKMELGESYFMPGSSILEQRYDALVARRNRMSMFIGLLIGDERTKPIAMALINITTGDHRVDDIKEELLAALPKPAVEVAPEPAPVVEESADAALDEPRVETVGGGLPGEQAEEPLPERNLGHAENPDEILQLSDQEDTLTDLGAASEQDEEVLTTHQS